MDERCRNQEAAMEFPHPNVGGPPSRPDNREGTFSSPPPRPAIPPNFRSFPLFSFYRDNGGSGETKGRGKNWGSFGAAMGGS